MSCFYDLTQESVYVCEEENSDSDASSDCLDLSSTQTPKEKSRPTVSPVHEITATKHEDTPCPLKPKDPESCQEDVHLSFPSLAPDETPRGGLANQETPPSAVAPTHAGTKFQERHNLLDMESPSVKLLLLRQDTSEQGNIRLILEKIWDLKYPIEVGRRLSQSAEVTNGLFNDRLVSRKHAIVYVEDDKVVLHDVGSSHGTFVNGQRVLTFKELSDGDRLNLGQTGKAPYIVQIIRGASASPKDVDDTNAEESAGIESKKRKQETDDINDVASFIFDNLDNVETRIAKRIRVSSAISAIVGGVVGGLSVGCAIVGLANMG